MKKLMVAVVAMILSNSLFADSYAFTYQAALRDEHGNVLEARNHNVNIRLWDAPTGGESPLWSRSFSVMTDANGVFNLVVSDEGGIVAGEEATSEVSLSSVMVDHEAGDLYIGLEVVGSAGEIVPRQRLFAVPFAGVANDVRRISKDVNVGGVITLGTNGSVRVTQDGILQKDGSSEFNKLTANTISAGTLTVSTAVTVNGTMTVNSNLAVANGKKLTVGGLEMIPVPVGGIIMWTQPTMPSDNWAICDGQHGTPDLRDRFIVGAGSKYDAGATGGAESVTLTSSQIPSHSHSYSVYAQAYKSSRMTGQECSNWAQSTEKGVQTRYTNTTGGGKSHENRPPYYALYYIMRVK